MPRLFEDLALARLDGRFPRLIDKLARVQMLILDDWGTHTLSDRQHLDLLEIFEERYRRKSTLITAQLPVAAWLEMIGEATLADAILDRIVHIAHRITLEGDSMRKKNTDALDRRRNCRNQSLLTATRQPELDRFRCPRLCETLVRDLLKPLSQFSEIRTLRTSLDNYYQPASRISLARDHRRTKHRGLPLLSTGWCIM